MQTETWLPAVHSHDANRAQHSSVHGTISTIAATIDPASASRAASSGAILMAQEILNLLQHFAQIYLSKAYAETRLETVQQWKRALDISLYTSFEETPLESCAYHPAEKIIEDALHTIPDGLAYSFLKDYCLDDEKPVYGASVLRCLSRLTSPGTPEWRAQIICGALTSSNLELRDNAIQAAESWEDRRLASILRAHEEPEPYLREYLQHVIAELSH